MQQRNLTRALAALFLIPFLGACSLTGGGLGTAAKSEPLKQASNAGPSQYASVSIPSKSQMLGKGPNYLTSLLGLPSLKRLEAGAELWQYQSPSCVALFYLYDEKGALKIAHFDARPRTDAFGQVSEDLCMKEVVATSKSRKAS